jgi:hypothetical protein
MMTGIPQGNSDSSENAQGKGYNSMNNSRENFAGTQQNIMN